MSKKKDILVKKSNSLVRSSWTMDSIWEARLVALVASKTRVGDVEFKEHEIPISELLEGADIQRSGQIYDIIEKAAKSLIRKIITIHEPSGRIIIAGVFAQCEIDPGSAIIRVAFAPALRPHYLQLREKFTQYSLEEFLQLSSTYSQRLFEILTSWKNIPDGEVTIQMPDLHEQLDTPPSQRKNFKEFRERVLEKAQKDITANLDASIDFEWEALKHGRKVVAVRFIFEPGRIEKERKVREDTARKLQHNRNTALMKAAWKCSSNMAIVPISEQPREQQAQKQEVCNVCRSQGMMKSLFPSECQRYGIVEIIEEKGGKLRL